MDTDDLMARADRFAEAERYEEAAELYALAAGEAGAGVKHASMLFFLEDYPVAERILREAVDSRDPDAFPWFADVLIATGRPAEAAHVMGQAAELGLPGAMLRTGAIWADLVGDRAAAEQWYRRAFDQGLPGARNDYGAFLSEDESRWAEAERMLLEAVEEGDDLALGNLGGLELDRGDLEAAIGWLERGVAARAEGSTALLKLAEAQERLGRDEEARRNYERAVAEGIPDANVKRALFLSDDGAPAEEVEAGFRRAVELDDDGALYYYAEFLAGQDREDEALACYHRAAEAGSDAAYEELGEIYLRRGDIAAAEDNFRNSIDAGWVGAVLGYARLLRQEGRDAEVAALVPVAVGLGATPEELRELAGED
ncbi:hypothetical protein DP939_15865 [Spongiactinospora rosea]|uniref:Tetratrico peptide repeat group 5 domain-containing protein n=1 Tax=Spongiactinospora rosea TaxID=2248750 RepID=A0A366M1T1_9ACTN|nr:tetratricopeptide repeat protein [Spongiactinospora rosea]RBQ19392.1 hypothetical protein DP939_15865 [Spongiactinospora rosea]